MKTARLNEPQAVGADWDPGLGPRLLLFQRFRDDASWHRGNFSVGAFLPV